MSNLMSAAEAAARLNIARRTLLDRVADGKVTPAMKMPGRTGAYLFSAAQVDALAAAQREEGDR